MKEAPLTATRCHPGSLFVSCPRLVRVSLPELWTRVWRQERSLQHYRETEKSEDREPCGPCWEQNFHVIDFQVHAAIFTKWKSLLEEQVLKPSAALYSAHLEGTRRRCGTYVSAKSCLPCACVFAPCLINHLVFQRDPYFELVFHSSLQDLPSIFTSDISPLKLLRFPLRRRKAALLRNQHRGFLLQPYILPR